MKKIAIVGSSVGALNFIHAINNTKKISLRNFVINIEDSSEVEKYKVLGIKVLQDKEAAVKNAHIVIFADNKFFTQEITDHLNLKKQILLNFSSADEVKSIFENVSSKNCFNIVMNNNLGHNESSIFVSTTCTDKYILNEITDFLEIIGEVLFISNELIDDAFVLNNCVSAFTMRFIRSMSLGGIQMGFDRKISNEIILKIIKGTINILEKGNSHSENEIDKLISEDNRLINGLNELEHFGFSFSVLKAIEASKSKMEIEDKREFFDNEIPLFKIKNL